MTSSIGYAALAFVALVTWMVIGAVKETRNRVSKRAADWLVPDSQPLTFRIGYTIAYFALWLGPRRVAMGIAFSPSMQRSYIEWEEWASAAAALSELDEDLRDGRSVDAPMQLTRPLLREAIELRLKNLAARIALSWRCAVTDVRRRSERPLVPLDGFDGPRLGTADTVEFRLVAIGPDGIASDLRISALREAPARSLITRVADQLGLDPSAPARLSGKPILGDAPLSEIALRDGDVLDFRLPSGMPAEAVMDLAVIGGPASGRRIPLSPGTHRVGREAEITIPDPLLSPVHVVLTVGADSHVEVTDVGSRSGTLVDGVALPEGVSRSLGSDEIVVVGRTLLAVAPIAGPTPTYPRTENGLVLFNRPPRVMKPAPDVDRIFASPPDIVDRTRIRFAATAIPSVFGIALWLVTRQPWTLLFTALSPVLAVSTFLEDTRDRRATLHKKTVEYLQSFERALRSEWYDELQVRRSAAPSAVDLLEWVRRLDLRLWERRRQDPDFLSLRLGSTDQPTHLRARVAPGGDERVRQRVEEIQNLYTTAPAVPIVVRLDEIATMAVTGPRHQVEATARWLVTQAIALHSPRELIVAAALDADRLAAWEWMKWLPHARPLTGGIARPLAAGGIATRALLDDLSWLLRSREIEADEAYAGSVRDKWPHVLVIVDERVAPEKRAMTRILSTAGIYEVSVLWLGRDRRDVPSECEGLLELDPETGRGSFTRMRYGTVITGIATDELAVDLARDCALMLAPIRDASDSSSDALPSHVPLLEALRIGDIRAESVLARWDSRRGGLDAVIGVTKDGPLSVDLRVDGPHSLIAGTTGSGKSELLQTLIASLALNHPPTRLNFLLIDYKGGTAFKGCARLPHTVGLVTDLDPHLVDRFLVSMRAELNRRESICRAANAKDLIELEQRDPDRAPPALVIIIDEFATIAREQPEFIAGVVDVAQRGRSLGIHLLLATQRPAGIVSDTIRANTNLRIALRVSDPSESEDVIGNRLAAVIRRDSPGRGLYRAGHGEVIEFQAAYGGGTSRPTTDQSVAVTAFDLGDTEFGASFGHDEQPDDLERTVDAIEAAAAFRGLERGQTPWLPTLRPFLRSQELRDSVLPAVGLIDDPEHQAQRPLVVDLEEGSNILVYGASRAGKSTLLRTLALALSERSSPNRLHLYALDFGGGDLRPLTELPHTGGVIEASDRERTERLFAYLRRELNERRRLLADRGVFTLTDYTRETDEVLPRIVVLLDNYAAFAATFERVNLGELVSELPKLMLDGAPLGIHFAVTAERRGEVPSALAAIASARIVLRLENLDDAAALEIPLKLMRDLTLPPGRGFLPGGIEVQIASDSDLQLRAERLRDEYPNAGVPPIRRLPDHIDRRTLLGSTIRFSGVIGVESMSLDQAYVSLVDDHFLVVGPYRSGRSTALGTLASSLHDATPGLELHLVAPRRTPLLDLEFWTTRLQSPLSDVEFDQWLDLMRPAEATRGLIVIDDAESIEDVTRAEQIERLVRTTRQFDGWRILAAAERQSTARAFSGFLRELRKSDHGLLLDPEPDDGALFGVRLPRHPSMSFPAGRGYLIDRGDTALIQVAL